VFQAHFKLIALKILLYQFGKAHVILNQQDPCGSGLGIDLH
jgi:hypothetical protein